MNSQNPHRLNNTIMRIKEHMPTWNTDKTDMQIHSKYSSPCKWRGEREEILRCCLSKPVSPFEIATFVQREKDWRRERRIFATVVVRAADDTVRNNEANERTDSSDAWPFVHCFVYTRVSERASIVLLEKREGERRSEREREGEKASRITESLLWRASDRC